MNCSRAALAEEKPTIQERMADEIVLMMRARGYCRARDLEAKGFAAEDIGHFWAYANALAAVALMPNNFTDIRDTGAHFHDGQHFH
jgi:hypothetical protein